MLSVSVVIFSDQLQLPIDMIEQRIAEALRNNCDILRHRTDTNRNSTDKGKSFSNTVIETDVISLVDFGRTGCWFVRKWRFTMIYLLLFGKSYFLPSI